MHTILWCHRDTVRGSNLWQSAFHLPQKRYSDPQMCVKFRQIYWINWSYEDSSCGGHDYLSCYPSRRRWDMILERPTMPSVEPLHLAYLQQIESTSSVSRCGQTIKHIKVLWGYFKGSVAQHIRVSLWMICLYHRWLSRPGRMDVIGLKAFEWQMRWHEEDNVKYCRVKTWCRKVSSLTINCPECITSEQISHIDFRRWLWP